MEVATITSSESPLFDKFWEIYQYSFPAHEKRTLENQKATLDNTPACKIDIFLEDKIVMGFILYWQFEGFLYIEHFAMSYESRNKGLGSKLLSSMAERFSPNLVILDIDPPVDEISIRRKGFYERIGFVTGAQKHIHPPYSKSDNTFELVVMSYGRAITDEEYLKFKNTLYNIIVTQ